MTASARELRRLKYLAAMGVTPVVSRRALPGAAPTVRLALKNLSEGAIATAAAPTAGSAPGKQAAAAVPAAAAPRALREMLEVDPRKNQRAAPETPASATVESAKTSGPSPAAETFRLSAIVCAERLWIEDLGDGALAREQLELVSNMARALVHPEPCPEPVVHQFDWPMHNNAQLQLGDEEAAASLQGFLARQLDDHSCVELLCLGDAARQRVLSLTLPCASRYLRSTRELLGAPLAKRDAWHTLRLS